MAMKVSTFSDLADEALIRQADIVRDPKRNDRAPLLSISSATLWRWVRQSRFPQPIRLGGNSTFWRVSDIRAWISAQAAA